MDLLSPRPFWPIRDGLPAVFPPLQNDVRCDVVIVGAGVSGALAAQALAKAGLDTVVLDRREVAHGSTSGSTSLLQYELDEPLHRLAKRWGREKAERCYRRCREAIEDVAAAARAARVECGFSRRASLLLASHESHVVRLQREFAARREAGIEVEWWTRRHLAKESSLPHPAAILSRDGAQVDAYRLTYGLLADAVRKGARVHERTAVAHTRLTARGVEMRTRQGARVRARHLVVATGFEAQQFLKRKIVALHSTYAMVTEPLDDFPGWPAAGCLIWETARPYLYLRITEDSRVMMGGYDEPFRDPLSRDRLLTAKTRALARRFKQFFPRNPIDVHTSWAGTFAATPDGLPYIGQHPERNQMWFALGYGGNGITFSAIAAELIRDGILGRKNADHELFALARRPGIGARSQLIAR
jgi:glycine/D-amino acid oxidase-like deaminating enzyme